MKFLSIIILFSFHQLHAQSISQQLYNCSFLQGQIGNLKIESSIGECHISTKSNSAHTITEGFLQPYVQKVIIYGNTYPCRNDSVILTAVGGSSYVWYDPYNMNDTLSTSNTYTYFADQNYEIAVKSAEGLVDSVTIEIKTIQECPYELIIYNLVTPNNDGVNDKFYIDNIDQSLSNYLTIYNRWGQLIYEKENYQNDWSPKNIANGTYVYILTDHTLNKEHRGKITIEK